MHSVQHPTEAARKLPSCDTASAVLASARNSFVEQEPLATLIVERELPATLIKSLTRVSSQSVTGPAPSDTGSAPSRWLGLGKVPLTVAPKLRADGRRSVVLVKERTSLDDVGPCVVVFRASTSQVTAVPGNVGRRVPLVFTNSSSRSLAAAPAAANRSRRKRPATRYVQPDEDRIDGSFINPETGDVMICEESSPRSPKITPANEACDFGVKSGKLDCKTVTYDCRLCCPGHAGECSGESGSEASLIAFRANKYELLVEHIVLEHVLPHGAKKVNKKSRMSCILCPKLFLLYGEVKDCYQRILHHMFVSHDRALPDYIEWYECDCCGFRTYSTSTLREHFKFKHVQMYRRRIPCEVCDAVMTVHSLKRHLLKVHGIDVAARSACHDDRVDGEVEEDGSGSYSGDEDTLNSGSSEDRRLVDVAAGKNDVSGEEDEVSAPAAALGSSGCLQEHPSPLVGLVDSMSDSTAKAQISEGQQVTAAPPVQGVMAAAAATPAAATPAAAAELRGEAERLTCVHCCKKILGAHNLSRHVELMHASQLQRQKVMPGPRLVHSADAVMAAFGQRCPVPVQLLVKDTNVTLVSGGQAAQSNAHVK